METQKVILPFFYALFLSDFPSENESDSGLMENDKKSSSQPFHPTPQHTLEKKSSTQDEFIQSN